MKDILTVLITGTLLLFQVSAGAHEPITGPTPFGEPGKPSQVDRVIKVDMKSMRFDPNRIKVSTGETIRFVITNSDPIDHEFVIGDAAFQDLHRKEMVQMAQMGHVMTHVDSNAVTVGAGQTGKLIWTFSREGRFEIDCNIEGHFEAGMSAIVDVGPAN